MEKEALLTELRKTIGEPDANGNYAGAGISQRTLDGYIDAVLPTFSDDITAESAAAIHLPIIKLMGGQMRHEIAERIKVINPQKTPEPNKGGTDEKYAALESKYEQLLNAQTEMQNKLKEREDEQKRTQVLKRVKALMKEQGADDEYVLGVVFKGESIPLDESEDKLAERYIKVYDSEYRKARGEGAIPRTRAEGGKGGNSATDLFFAKKAAREGWGKKTN